MNTEMRHNTETGELEIYSNANGELLFKMTSFDITFGQLLNTAFRKAEELSSTRIRNSLGYRLSQIEQELYSGDI